jgi:drug/metabolite transporter (DMT)-like permease
MGLKIFGWLAMLALLWGPSFLFVKVAVQDIPPVTLVAVRVSLAAMILYTVLKIQRQRLPTSASTWKHFAVMGLTFNALPFVLLSWAQLHIDSALAAIVNGTTPLFTVILAHLLTREDRFTPAKLGGVLLGFAGLVLLVAPALGTGVQATVWGLLASIAAAASYSLATVYSRQHLRGLPPLIAPAAQLTMAAIYLIPLSLLVERPYMAPLPGWPAIIALLLLTLLSTALPFVIFYRLVEKTSATNLSLVTYMVPVVATILGIVVLHEQPGWNVYLSLVLIVLGVMTVNGMFRVIDRHRFMSMAAKS